MRRWLYNRRVGSFPGTTNDASIIQQIFNSDQNIVNLLQPKDIVVDREFRDSVSFLKNKQLEVAIPLSMQPKKKQLSSLEVINYINWFFKIVIKC